MKFRVGNCIKVVHNICKITNNNNKLKNLKKQIHKKRKQKKKSILNIVKNSFYRKMYEKVRVYIVLKINSALKIRNQLEKLQLFTCI